MLSPRRTVKKTCIKSTFRQRPPAQNLTGAVSRYPNLHTSTIRTSTYRVSCKSPTSPYEMYTHDPSVDEYLSQSILKTGKWHENAMDELFRLIDKIISKTPAIGVKQIRALDVGANIGYLSFLIASYSPLVQVIAIEPHPMHANLLEKSLVLNPTLKVDLIKVAVSRPEDDGKYLV